jgi:two-component system, LytTR family, sensor kinase
MTGPSPQAELPPPHHSEHWGQLAMLAGGAVLLLSTLEATQLLVRASLEGWSITVPSVVLRIVSSWLVLAVLSLMVWKFALRFPVSSWSARRLGIHVAATMVFAALHVSGTALALVAIDPRHDVPRTMSFLGVAYGALDVLLYMVIVGMANSWRYARVAAQRTLTTVQLSEALQRSQLDVVRRQLDPHFLFNTLNAISALALRGNGTATADAIAILSDLLRQTLRSDAPALHSLEEELYHVERYLAIVDMRFPAAITLRIDADAPVRQLAVPCLALQPLVENAILHGFAGGSRPGTIVVSARQSSDRLTIVVEDDGVGAEPHATRRAGIGLSSLKARLAYGFGQAATLELAGGTDGKGTRVTLQLPMQQEQR